MLGNAPQNNANSAALWERQPPSQQRQPEYHAYQMHDQAPHGLVLSTDRGDHHTLYSSPSDDFTPEYGIYDEMGMLSDDGALLNPHHAEHNSEPDPTPALAPSPMEASSGNETVFTEAMYCYSPSPPYMDQSRGDSARTSEDLPSVPPIAIFEPQNMAPATHHPNPTYMHRDIPQFPQAPLQDASYSRHFPPPPTHFHPPPTPQYASHPRHIHNSMPSIHRGSAGAPGVQMIPSDMAPSGDFIHAPSASSYLQHRHEERNIRSRPSSRPADDFSSHFYQPHHTHSFPPQQVPTAPYSHNYIDLTNTQSAPIHPSHIRSNDNFGSQRVSSKASKVSRSRQRHLSLPIESRENARMGDYNSELCQSDSAVALNYYSETDASLAQSYEIPVDHQLSGQYQSFTAHPTEVQMPPPSKRMKNFSRSPGPRHAPGAEVHKSLSESNTKRPVVLFHDTKAKPIFCEAPTAGSLRPIVFDPAAPPYHPLFGGPVIFEDSRYRHLKEFYADPLLSNSSSLESPEFELYEAPRESFDSAVSNNQAPTGFIYDNLSAPTHQEPGLYSEYQTEGEPMEANAIYPPESQLFGSHAYESSNSGMHISSPSKFVPTVNPTLLENGMPFTPTPLSLQPSHQSQQTQEGQLPYYTDFKLAKLRRSPHASFPKSPTSSPSSSSSTASFSRFDSLSDSPDQVNATKKPSTVKVQAWSLNGQVLSCPDFASAKQKERHLPSGTKKGSSKTHMELKLYLQRKRLVLIARPPGCNCKHSLSFPFFDIAALVLQGAHTSENDYLKASKDDSMPKYVALTLAMSQGGEYSYKLPQSRTSSKGRNRSSMHPEMQNPEAHGENFAASFVPPPVALNHNHAPPPAYSASYGAEDTNYGYYLPVEAMDGTEGYHQNHLPTPSYIAPPPSYKSPSYLHSSDASSYLKSKRSDDHCPSCGPADPSLPYHPAMGLFQPTCAHSNSCSGYCTDSIFSSHERHAGERYITLILERNAFAASKSKPCPFARLLLTDPYLAHIARVEAGYERISSPFKNLRIVPLALLRDRLLCQLELMFNYLLYYGKAQFSLSMSFDVKHDYNWDTCTNPCCIEPPSISRSDSSRNFARHVGKKDLRAALRESTVAQTPHSQEPKPESPTSSFAFYILDIRRAATFRGDDCLEPQELRYICEAIHLGHSRTISFPRPDPKDRLPFGNGLMPELLVPEAEWIAQNAHASQSNLTSPHLRNPEMSSNYGQSHGWPPYPSTPMPRFVFPPSVQFSQLERELMCPNGARKKTKNGSPEFGGEEAESERADGQSFSKNTCSRTSFIVSKERIEYIFGDNLKRLYDIIPN